MGCSEWSALLSGIGAVLQRRLCCSAPVVGPVWLAGLVCWLEGCFLREAWRTAALQAAATHLLPVYLQTAGFSLLVPFKLMNST